MKRLCQEWFACHGCTDDNTCIVPLLSVSKFKKVFSFDYVIKQLTGKCFYYFRKMDDIALDQPAGRIELDSTCKSL